MNKNFLKRRIEELEDSGTGGGTSYPNETTLLKFSENTGGLLWDNTEITSVLHTHTNKTLLDNLGETNGELTYNGVVVDTVIEDTNTFEALTDTPNAYIGEAGKIVSVKSTEDGLEFITPSSGGSSTFTALTDTPNTLGTSGQFLKMVTDINSNVNMEWQNFPTIPQELLDFSEWPNQNTATSGQVLTLSSNMSGGNDLEWQTPSSSSTLTALTDTPATYGTAGQVLATNSTTDGTEWITPSTGGGASVTHGTYTPVIVIDNTGTPAGVTYNIQSGYWWRVGDLITVNGRVLYTSTGTNQATRITLPFDVLEGDYAGTISAVVNSPISKIDFVGDPVNYVTATLNSNSNQLWIVGDTGRLMGTGTTTTYGIAFSITYREV